MALENRESESDSHVPYYETCCVCDGQFFSSDDFLDHFIAHTKEEFYIKAIKALEEREAAKYRNDNYFDATFDNSLKRTYSQRSNSPDIEIISDDSDDDTKFNALAWAEPLLRREEPTTCPVQTRPLPAQMTSMRAQTTPPAQMTSMRVQTTPPAQMTSMRVQTTPPAQMTSMRAQATYFPAQRGPPQQQYTNAISFSSASAQASSASVRVRRAPATVAANPGRQTPSIRCIQCNSFFPDVLSYQQHSLEHGKITPYCCSVCNKKFTFKATLRQHLQMHNVDSNYECKFCRKRFSEKRMLQQHEELHKFQAY